MRTVIAAGLLVLSTALHAALPTPIHGINQYGEEITIDIPDLPDGNDYSVVVKTNGKVKDYAKEPFTYSEGKFSCSTQGRSPLAGATFKHFSKAPYFGGCGRVLTCIEGCGPRVPQELFEDAYECFPEPEVACGSPIDEGVVDGDVVNVRDNPHIDSRVLRTAAKAVRITVLKRDSVCFKMNGKDGQWVRVRLHDNDPVKEGWLFDAFIKYEYHPTGQHLSNPINADEIYADEDSFLCLKSIHPKKLIKLKFTFPQINKTTGSVFYQNGNSPIPVKLKVEKTIEKGLNEQLSIGQSAWEESTKEGITGNYYITAQGGKIIEFKYVRKDGEVFLFEVDGNASKEDGCKW